MLYPWSYLVLFAFTGFLGVLFRKEVTSALSMMSSCLALAAVFGTLSVAYKLFSLTAKLYMAIVLNIAATACYVVLEILLKKGAI